MNAKRYDLNSSTLAFLGLLLLFFGVFLFYPAGRLLHGAFVVGGHVGLGNFKLLLSSPLHRQALLNIFLLSLLTTGLAALLTVPLAYVMRRFRFPVRALLRALLLLTMITTLCASATCLQPAV